MRAVSNETKERIDLGYFERWQKERQIPIEAMAATCFDQFVADLETALPKIDNFGETRWNVKNFFIIFVANPSFPVTGKYGDACADGFWVRHNIWLGRRQVDIAARVTSDGEHVEVYSAIGTRQVIELLARRFPDRMDNCRWEKLSIEALQEDGSNPINTKLLALQYLFSAAEKPSVDESLD